MKIEKTDNGWTIEPHTANEAITLDTVMVILEKAYCQTAKGRHVTEAPKQSSPGLVADKANDVW